MRKKLVSTLLCATVLMASLTIGAAAATPKDHVYRGDHATITNVVSYDENYTVSQGGPGLPIHCVAPVKITPTNPEAVYWLENLIGVGQYLEGADITEAGIEITQAGEYAVSYDVSYGGGGDGYGGSYYLIVEEKNGAEPSDPGTSTGTFSDVPANAYYAEAVKWAVSEGVTTGTTATTFSPNSTCTTAQILTFLWRANGSPAPTGKNAAVPAGQYYTDAANWALEKGLTDAFSADAPATRAATVTYLWKLAGKPTADAAPFTDVDAGAAYAQAVAWAVKEGITAGTSATTFAPDNTCTRGQIMTFLYRDTFGESTSENSSSNGQVTAPDAGGNSYDQRISALMAEGYTQEEAHKILELMAGGYSEESAKNLVRMTDEELEQQQKDFEEWVESVGGSYDPETGGVWLP